MEKIQIGHSDLYAAQLGLGCINFGTTIQEDQAFVLIDKYISEGGNLLDTSNNYAFWNSKKERDSELCIGRWIKAHPSLRNQLILATKLGALPRDMEKGFDAMQGNSAKVIREEVQKSLYALQTDYIDLLYLHVDDYQTPLEETLGALSEEIAKGYVRSIGCSNFRTWRIEQARQICKENHFPFFCAVQQRYSYLQPVIDADFGVQVCGDNELKSYLAYYQDLTFVAHTPLLYGAYQRGQIEDKNYDTAENRDRLAQLSQLGEEKIPWVLKYITQQFGKSIVLFTSSSEKHLEQNIRYLSH